MIAPANAVALLLIKQGAGYNVDALLPDNSTVPVIWNNGLPVYVRSKAALGVAVAVSVSRDELPESFLTISTGIAK